MNYSNNWRKILIVWVAIGISVSGYFYIFPNMVRVHKQGRMAKQMEAMTGPTFEKTPVDKVSLLITVVGAFLIGGFGRLSVAKNEIND